MRRLVFVLTCSALLLSASACGVLPQRELAIPDPTVPHQLAQPAVLHLWVAGPDGKFIDSEYQVGVDWWIASPQVVQPVPSSAPPPPPAKVPPGVTPVPPPNGVNL